MPAEELAHLLRSLPKDRKTLAGLRGKSTSFSVSAHVNDVRGKWRQQRPTKIIIIGLSGWITKLISVGLGTVFSICFPSWMCPLNEFCEDGTVSYVMKLLLENMGFKTGSVEDWGCGY